MEFGKMYEELRVKVEEQERDKGGLEVVPLSEDGFKQIQKMYGDLKGEV